MTEEQGANHGERLSDCGEISDKKRACAGKAQTLFNYVKNYSMIVSSASGAFFLTLAIPFRQPAFAL